MKPREKIALKGVHNLNEVELVSLLVGSGVEGRSYEEIARSLVALLLKVKTGAEVSLSQINQVEGVGFATASKIAAAVELGRRLFSNYPEGLSINNTKEACSYFSELAERKKEYVKALFLNARYTLISSEVISIGTISRVSVTPRDLIMPALEANAVYIILGHNHPSGDVRPSQSDILLTKRIVEACELLSIKLLDHIIVGRGGKWSTVKIEK